MDCKAEATQGSKGPGALFGPPLKVPEWLDENKKHFLPPVCNKMMHNSQLKVFYVGGPNQRKDYHLEEGEELFFMRTGAMNLKVVEGGRFVDVPIKQGEVFLLPAKIPHSPQREAGTVGLVIERERLPFERDGLRYFVEGGTPKDILYQRWFYCQDLGQELGPIIKAFFASHQHHSGVPDPIDLAGNPSAWVEDSKRELEKPFNLYDWLGKNMRHVFENGEVELFDSSRYQSDVKVLGRGSGDRLLTSRGGETFLWQLKGGIKVDMVSSGQAFDLAEDDTLLIPSGESYTFCPKDDQCATLSVTMNPENAKRV